MGSGCKECCLALCSMFTKPSPKCTPHPPVRGSSPPLPLAHQPTWLFPRTTTSSQAKLNLASQTSLSFQLLPSANSTSSLQTPQRTKVGEFVLTQVTYRYPLSNPWGNPDASFHKTSPHFPSASWFQPIQHCYRDLLPLSVLPQTDSQLTSCFWVFLHTVTRKIQTEYSLSSLPGLKFSMQLILRHWFSQAASWHTQQFWMVHPHPTHNSPHWLSGQFTNGSQTTYCVFPSYSTSSKVINQTNPLTPSHVARLHGDSKPLEVWCFTQECPFSLPSPTGSGRPSPVLCLRVSVI